MFRRPQHGPSGPPSRGVRPAPGGGGRKRPRLGPPVYSSSAVSARVLPYLVRSPQLYHRLQSAAAAAVHAEGRARAR